MDLDLPYSTRRVIRHFEDRWTLNAEARERVLFAQDSDQIRKKITIIGVSCSLLRTAIELSALGFEVTVLAKEGGLEGPANPTSVKTVGELKEDLRAVGLIKFHPTLDKFGMTSISLKLLLLFLYKAALVMGTKFIFDRRPEKIVAPASSESSAAVSSPSWALKVLSPIQDASGNGPSDSIPFDYLLVHQLVDQLLVANLGLVSSGEPSSAELLFSLSPLDSVDVESPLIFQVSESPSAASTAIDLDFAFHSGLDVAWCIFQHATGTATKDQIMEERMRLHNLISTNATSPIAFKEGIGWTAQPTSRYSAGEGGSVSSCNVM